jgi:hypothetical protein
MAMRILLLLAVAGLLLAQKIPPATFHGTVHDVSKKKMTIENEDGNLLDFDINRKTQLMRGKTEISSADFETGEPVTIEAKQVMGKFLVAVSITAEPKSKN